jgi:putative endonuclease
VSGPLGGKASRLALGRRAERAVEEHLRANGYAILAKNLRLGALEIDLLARRGPLVVIVEVRTRGPGSFVGPFASVTPKKRANLLRAAERLYRTRLASMHDVERLRIDVAGVHFEGERVRIEYAEGAIVG